MPLLLQHRLIGPQQRGFTDLKDVSAHQDDGLEGGSAFVGQLVERLLLAPALLQQGVADDAGRALEARAEVEGDVGARFGAAAAGQVDLEPAGERAHTGAGLEDDEQPPQESGFTGLLCVIGF